MQRSCADVNPPINESAELTRGPSNKFSTLRLLPDVYRFYSTAMNIITCHLFSLILCRPAVEAAASAGSHWWASIWPATDPANSRGRGDQPALWDQPASSPFIQVQQQNISTNQCCGSGFNESGTGSSISSASGSGSGFGSGSGSRIFMIKNWKNTAEILYLSFWIKKYNLLIHMPP